MIVCLCHRVSERQIHLAVAQGCADFEQLQDELRVATACGACHDCAMDCHGEALRARVLQRPVLAWLEATA